MSNIIITINRESGSGGREVAYRLGEMLGLKVYDKAILECLSEKYNLNQDEIERIKAKGRIFGMTSANFTASLVPLAKLINRKTKRLPRESFTTLRQQLCVIWQNRNRALLLAALPSMFSKTIQKL